jgi:hypothetical protein
MTYMRMRCRRIGVSACGRVGVWACAKVELADASRRAGCLRYL